MARLWLYSPQRLARVYDTASGSFSVPALQLASGTSSSTDARQLLEFQFMLSMSDEELVEATSTSPAHEGPGFAAGVTTQACMSLRMAGMQLQHSIVINATHARLALHTLEQGCCKLVVV